MAKQRRKSITTERHWTISRRKFFEDVLAASAAAGVGLRATAGSSMISTSPTTSTANTLVPAARFKVLTSEQGGVLTSVVNRVVPADGAMPGAGDVGVVDYIDDLLADAAHLRRPILDILAAVQSAQDEGHLSGDEMDKLLATIERQQKASFNVLLQAAYTGYYGRSDVLKAIGWVESDDPREEFDATLLEAVRQRGPISRADI
jgi:hypothetical protein